MNQVTPNNSVVTASKEKHDERKSNTSEENKIVRAIQMIAPLDFNGYDIKNR